MKRIFSPWRMKYIEKSQPVQGCVFCGGLLQPDGPENLILARGERVFAMLNRFPYTGGHLMILPYAHESTFEVLEAATRAEIMEWITRGMGVLRKVYNPQAFNIGANIGAAAGAGIAEHVHFHVVPRWAGDSNFMSAVADTRVLPEDLEETYRRLKAAW